MIKISSDHIRCSPQTHVLDNDLSSQITYHKEKKRSDLYLLRSTTGKLVPAPHRTCEQPSYTPLPGLGPFRWWSAWKPACLQRCTSRKPGGLGWQSRKTPTEGECEGESTTATASSSIDW